MGRARKRFFGQVRKRRGRYSVRVRVRGQSFCRPFGTDRKVAEAFLSRLHAATMSEDALGVVEVGRATWAEFWPTLEAWLKAEHAETTFASEKGKARVIGEWMRGRALAEVTRADVENFLTHVRNDRGGGDAAVNRYRALLSVAFQRAVLHGYAAENPTEGIRWHREQERDVPFLSPKVLDTVLEAAGETDRPLFTLAADTGMRRSELLDLQATGVDFRAVVVVITRSKGKRTRRIPLTPRALAVLKPLVKAAAGGYLFPAHRKNPTGVSRRFRLAARRAGLPTLTFHGLRHAYASALAAAGVAPGVIGDLLGDSTARVVFKYLRHAPGRAEYAAVAALAKARGQVGKRSGGRHRRMA